MRLKSTFLAFKKVLQVVQIGGRGGEGRGIWKKFKRTATFFGKPSLSKGFPCEKIETEASSFDVVQISLNSTNSRVVSKAAHVRKFLLLPTDFSMAGGELTPTLKVFFLQIIKRVLDEQKTVQERL